MCRMVAAPSGVPGDKILEPFLRMARGENAVNEKNTVLGLVKHGDGWGGVLEHDGRVDCIRRPAPCWSDPAFSRIRAASVRLLHARLASVAGPGERNVHPFAASVAGATWHFCHNGTLRDEPDDGTQTTDSERFFRRLAPLLERQDPVPAFERTASVLRDVTALNSLLLGPAGLWAFCVWTDPLYRAYYTLYWAETPTGAVVSSEPLEEIARRWVPMENRSAIFIPATSAGTALGVRPFRLCLP